MLVGTYVETVRAYAGSERHLTAQYGMGQGVQRNFGS